MLTGRSFKMYFVHHKKCIFPLVILKIYSNNNIISKMIIQSHKRLESNLPLAVPEKISANKAGKKVI